MFIVCDRIRQENTKFTVSFSANWFAGKRNGELRVKVNKHFKILPDLVILAFIPLNGW